MKLTKRIVALLLTAMLVLTALPLSIFATETAALELSYESDIYTDETLSGYKQYQGTWTDSTYVNGTVQYTVYFDKENATETRDVILYVINWNGERIGENSGEHSDVQIVYDNIMADPAVETGRRAMVIVVDFGGNTNAVPGKIEFSLAQFRADLPSSVPVWVDPTAEEKTTTTAPINKNYTFVLPAGYRVMRDVLYFQSDVHGSLGTLNSVMSTWNTQVAFNPTSSTAAGRYASGKLPKTVNYYWHTGDDTCTCTANGATNECFAGSPQEKDGVIIPCDGIIVTHTGDKATCAYPHDVLTTVACTKDKTANVNWAPVVTRVEDCRKRDGSPMDYNCRLDIIYPSAGKDAGIETPVFTQAATQSPRMNNIGTIGWDDYDDDGVSSMKSRAAFVGFSFSGYTCAAYDYAYIPMARGDHYGYIDGYGFHGQNGAKTSRAAIRCIRYFAEELGYSSELIGAAGISKGTPTTAVLSTVDNKYVQETSTFTYTVNGESVQTRGLYYEGDLNADGSVTAGRTKQPYMFYEDGFNTTSESGTEISSEVSVVYCAAGDGINWVSGKAGGNNSIMLGAEYTYTDENGVEQTRVTQHVPMILSCGFYDEYGCWNLFDDVQNRFTEYAANPFLQIPMEDMGHDYPSGHDPLRDYDRYNAFNQFFHSILKPELYESQVAYVLPVDGSKDVSVAQSLQVQLIKPAASLDAFAAATTVKDPYGNAVIGVWSTNEQNTSGLYTFVPTQGYLGDTEYTVTVGDDVVSVDNAKRFTTEAAGFLRPIADTYVSAANKTGVFGTEKTLYIDNQRTYLATFNTADFEDDNLATLNLPLSGAASQELTVYLINDYEVDEATTCYNNMPALTDDMIIGKYTVTEGACKLNLKGIASLVKGDTFTLAINGSANYLELNFENYTSGTTIPSYNSGDSSIGTKQIWHDTYVLKESGSVPRWKAASDGDNMVATYANNATQTYHRMKLYNSISTDALTKADIGKTFNASFRIKATASAKANYGFMQPDTSPNTYMTTGKAVGTDWTTFSKSITLSDAHITDQIGMFVIGTETKSVNYFFDDIVVAEVAPTAVISREDTSAMTTYISTGYRAENRPLADTYVSKASPDTAFGLGTELLLNGGSAENIVFTTYSAKALDGKNRIELAFPIENDTSVEAEILLLDGYYVDEGTLTYNNMPDLTDAVSLGKYTLKGGSNILDIWDAAEKIKSPYFTLVFKSTDTSDFHFYFQNFEDMTVGSQLKNGAESETVDDTTYYYAYSDTNFMVCGSGWGQGSLVIAVDPHDENNQVIKTSSTSGRARLYNALSYDDLTMDDLDKTYRFTFKVKSVDGSASSVRYGIMEVNGYNKWYVDKTISTVTSGEWTTVSIDMKLRDAIGEEGVTAVKDPAIFIESKAFYYDDIAVIELNSDGGEPRAVFASVESDEGAIKYAARSVGDPVSDTYVSAADITLNPAVEQVKPGSMKDVNYGDGEELYVSGKTSAIGERVTLISYSKKALEGGNVVTLNIPALNDTSAKVKVYVLGDYKVNEDTMTYTVYENEVKGKMTLVGEATLTKGNNVIDLGSAAPFGGEYFTLILTAAADEDHIYLANFENWPAGTTGNSGATEMRNSYFQGYDSNGYKGLFGDFHAYSDKNFYTRGSNASYGYMTVQNDPDGSDNKVVEYKVKTSGPRIRLTNTTSFDLLTEDDIGKTYRFTFRIKAMYADGEVKTAKSTMGAMRTYGSSYETNSATANTSTSAHIQTNGEWHEFTFDYVIKKADLVADQNTLTNHSTAVHSDPVFTIVFSNPDTSKTLYYYLDDLQVIKLDENGKEPTVVMASRENADETAQMPSVKTLNAFEAVADTYVSRVNPNAVYGNEKTLMLGDANGDKKVMALSFMNKALDESNYVQLKLSNGGNALKDVSVYYVMDYCIDESSLTWNTMPDYEDNLLCTMDIEAGDNKIDVSALRDKLAGDYFTLIFRTENHSFGLNFEDEKLWVGKSFSDGKKDTDETIGSATYYHGYTTEELETYVNNGISYYLGRRNGVLGNRVVIVDPEDPNNHVIQVSTGASQNYGGRLKFYNSMSYKELTEDDIGKTYRYTIKVRAAEGNPADLLSVLAATACVTTSKSEKHYSAVSSVITTPTVTFIKETASSAELQNGWVTLSLDYTIDASHIPTKIDDATYSYPMFGIYFADTKSGASFTYQIDDISVVEIVDGQPVGDATFASHEEANDVRFVSALDGGVTVMETTVSSATTGDVFSIVDGGKTHSLLSVKDNKLVFDEYTLCDGKGVAYVLDENEIKVTAIYDDTLGTVRFAIGEKLAFYAADKATYNHLVIEGGVGDDASFGVSGITATKMNSTTSELIGYQKNLVDDTSVRFLTGVDTLYYSAIGFDIERDGVALQKQSNSPYVFTAVTIGEETEEATEYGYNYMTALVIGDITTGGVIKVTPYVMIGENKISGESSYYKITTNGGMTLEKTTEDEVEKAYSADLASLTVDGDPVVGFSADVLNYVVPAFDPTAMNVVAVVAEEGATAVVSQNGNVATITVSSFNGKVQKVYTLTAFEKLASEVVNKNGANAIVTYVFDDGDKTTATIVTDELSTKYESLSGSFALITKNLGTLSTIEGEEGDGLLEYEFDENGDYVYTKNADNWAYWETLLDTYGASGFEAVSHTHTHAYIGENDNGGSFTYKNTAGDVFTSAVFPKGNVHKEYYASNQILRDLGQRAYALVSAGLTAGGSMIDYTASYKALPQTSGAFIGKRTTNTQPTNPSAMVNYVEDFTSETKRFDVYSYMVQHYYTSATAPKNTSAENYSKEACLAAGIDYWTNYVDTAVEEGGWAAFCFHNIKPDTHTGTTGHFVYQSQADALFAHTQVLSEQNKVWVANLTDAMLYVFERSTSEVGAYVDGDGNVIVTLDDHEDDTIFTMPLTVKVALPEGKTGAALDGKALTAFTEDGVTYVYVDIVPGNSVTLTVQ